MKVRGQGYDGCAVISGHMRGVKLLLKYLSNCLCTVQVVHLI